MILRTVQWNIGGGKVRNEEDDPMSYGVYCNEGLDAIIEKLREYEPDIITLQESHSDEVEKQAALISKKLGLPYYSNDVYDVSHIETSKKLSQAIISRFPITQHSFEFFFNPPYKKVMENGEEWVSHNKGISTVVLEVDGKTLTVQTLHMIPYRKFDVDFNDANGLKVRTSIESTILADRTSYLLQGDFNHSDIKTLLPNVKGLKENETALPTTPRGRVYDHVLYRGLVLTSQSIDKDVLNDHFPIISSFEFQ